MYLHKNLTIYVESISALGIVSSGDVGLSAIVDGDNENGGDGAIQNCFTIVDADFGGANGVGIMRGANNNPGGGNARGGTIATTVVGTLC